MSKKASMTISQRKMRDLIYCLIVIAIPVIQFCIFYIGVNANSILMAFQRYEVDPSTNLGSYVFIGFQNFEKAFYKIFNEQALLSAFKNSLIAFAVSVLIGTTLSLVFSLYIYKKMPMYKFFRVMLFLPSILSSIVTVTMYKNFVEVAIPNIFNLDMGLLGNPNTKMVTILFFNVWIGFGTQLLMYSGAMNTIDQSIIEAAKLDGVSPMREFISIILPLIYPTIVTFLVVNLSSLFTNQLNIFSFYGNSVDSKYWTIGYMLFKDTNLATNAELPLLATYSVILTVIAVPLTLLGKKFVEVVGPKVD